MALELDEAMEQQLDVAFNAQLIDEKAFQALVKGVFAIAFEEATEADLLGAGALQNANARSVKQAYTGLLTLVLEAAKQNLNGDSLRSTDMGCVQDCNGESRLFFTQTHRLISRPPALCLILVYLDLVSAHSTTFHIPHLEDVEWRLDQTTRGSHLDKIDEPRFNITFRTTNDESNTTISCDLARLQDLVAKLESACAAVQSLAEAS
ncbi:uncharacterized protein MONBRDRAFT_26225 [Monosiga brevicollis MX1]|uniref:COMM domain-containing protein 3 n=1 Tax=Monosiga brevicollis TaxID=81824 RepID=A9V1Q6_MONBE|nr:uncharacterized protein MONBRDRAFT_26225 [Monosiga brevicollis MX1]EDQ88486.1 predicted protein [Monosiga brevicollis MX1]|eukprot:XP_001746590.1 hypothetical protein [Monosiga brevicollis MX1]